MVMPTGTESAVAIKSDNGQDKDVPIINNYVNGSFVQSKSDKLLDITDPIHRIRI